MENEKIVFISTIGVENQEKTTLPWSTAVAAQTVDVDVVMILQSDAVVLAKKGEAEKIQAKGLMPLKQLLDTFLELGGKLYLCSPCIEERKIEISDLVEGAEVVAAGTIVDELLTAKSTVTY